MEGGGLMPTRKEILENKDQWIEALKETIDKYQECIDNNINYDNDSNGCTLCLLDDELNKGFSDCKHCIHFSSFSQNKGCYNQRSFGYDKHWTITEMKVRKRFLIRVLKRLEDAS